MFDEPLPGFEQAGGPATPGQVVGLAAVGLAGEIALLVALDKRFRQTKVMHIGRSYLGLPDKSAPFVHRQMRLLY
jgi:hypothetical protein